MDWKEIRRIASSQKVFDGGKTHKTLSHRIDHTLRCARTWFATLQKHGELHQRSSGPLSIGGQQARYLAPRSSYNFKERTRWSNKTCYVLSGLCTMLSSQAYILSTSVAFSLWSNFTLSYNTRFHMLDEACCLVSRLGSFEWSRASRPPDFFGHWTSISHGFFTNVAIRILHHSGPGIAQQGNSRSQADFSSITEFQAISWDKQGLCVTRWIWQNSDQFSHVGLFWNVSHQETPISSTIFPHNDWGSDYRHVHSGYSVCSHDF